MLMAFYSFTTVNRSKINVQQSDSDVIIDVENKRFSLKMKTRTSSENFMLLNGPRNGKITPLVQENLQGEVQVSLRDKEHNKIIFEDKGFCTGIEYGGKQMMVLDG